MTETFDLVVRGGVCLTPSGRAETDIGVRGGRITAIGAIGAGRAEQEIDATGLHVLPGVIDTQVHFREPGLEHKEDLATGTRAAVLGGVTAVFEMPNTTPNTDTAERLADKVSRATGRAWCDFAFFVGATTENADGLGELERLPGCCGVKIFMGSSTGSLLVAEDEALLRALSSGRRRVAVHSEDEARLNELKAALDPAGGVAMHPEFRDVDSAVRATTRLLALARQARRPVHVLHISTAEELPLLAAAKDIATCEVTPQHLTLAAPDCYERLGSFAQMNPPIREARHRDALWEAVRAGLFDVTGSDHAPHTKEEKAQPYPKSPSGMPGVQTLVPLLLDHVAAGRMSLERFVDLTSAGPQRIYDIAGKGRIALGYDADLTLVDLGAKREVEQDWVASKSGWSPFTGQTLTGWPMATVIRGRTVMREGELSETPEGRPVRFVDTLDG